MVRVDSPKSVAKVEVVIGGDELKWIGTVVFNKISIVQFYQ